MTTVIASPIRIRAHVRDGVTQVRLLMPHPMETGLRQDAGTLVPAHHITDVLVMHGERAVFAARMSAAVSRDPLVAFRFRGARAGERLRVTWTDNRGESRRDDAVIA